MNSLPHAAANPKRYAMAFFDVQNLFRHAKDAFQDPNIGTGYHHPNFDPKLLHQKVSHQLGLIPTLTRYYTGVPSVSDDPMWGGYWNNRVLALKRAGVIVETRRLRYHLEAQPDGSVVRIGREKGIDIRIALDLVRCTRKKEYDVAILFSRDQDLGEAVEEAKQIAIEQQRLIRIVSAFPEGPFDTPGRGIDRTDWFRIDKALYDACLDPRDYRPAKYQGHP